MPKFRKKPVEIEAIQWNALGGHPEVEDVPVKIVFDRGENYFYVSGLGGESHRMSSFWLALNEEIAAKHGDALPFAYYEVKSGKEIVADTRPDLVEAYAKAAGWGERRPLPFGRIKTLEGTMSVQLGDWIIRGVKGELYACKPDIFAETYDLVEV